MAGNDGASVFDPKHDSDEGTSAAGGADRVARIPSPEVEQRVMARPAKTSAAAAFGLVFGVAALLSVLTVILSPVGLVLGIIGLILGFVGIRMARRTGVTGKGVAIGGLVLSLLAVLLSITVAAGVTTVLNNDKAVDRLQTQVDKLRDNLPDKVTVPQP